MERRTMRAERRAESCPATAVRIGTAGVAGDAVGARGLPSVLPCLIAAMAVLVFSACRDGVATQGRASGPQSVHALVLEPERVERIVEITGTLGGAEEVTVAAEVDGRVEKVLADLGDRVEPGAPLIQLDVSELRLKEAQADSDYLQSLARLGVDAKGLDKFVPEAQADVRRSEADLADAKRNLDRGDELMKRGLLAESELDTLRTRTRIAEATLQKALEDARSNFALAKGRRASLGLARKKLRDATIATPIAGSVAKRMVALGEYVKAGQPVAVVVMTDPLKLHGEAADRYMGQLRAGMPVEIDFDITGLETHMGELARIGPLVSATSHTFPVEALFPNAEGKLKPGIFARARIRIGSDEEVFVAPETAISSVAGVHKIFVVKDGRAQVRPITILGKRGGDALFQGEIAAGDQLILTGIARMYEGAEVKIQESKGDAVVRENAAAAPGARGAMAGPDGAAKTAAGRPAGAEAGADNETGDSAGGPAEVSEEAAAAEDGLGAEAAAERKE